MDKGKIDEFTHEQVDIRKIFMYKMKIERKIKSQPYIAKG